jgi:DNA-binding NarL/FixJ family response regulator
MNVLRIKDKKYVTTAILALEKDLFFAVKIRDTLRHHDMEVTIVRTLPALEERLASTGAEKPALVIINIATKGVDWESAIRQAREQGFPVLAFGSHMDLEARARALEAGAQRVVANSKFARGMPGLVTRMLQGEIAGAVSSSSDDDDS